MQGEEAFYASRQGEAPVGAVREEEIQPLKIEKPKVYSNDALQNLTMPPISLVCSGGIKAGFTRGWDNVPSLNHYMFNGFPRVVELDLLLWVCLCRPTNLWIGTAYCSVHILYMQWSQHIHLTSERPGCNTQQGSIRSRQGGLELILGLV